MLSALTLDDSSGAAVALISPTQPFKREVESITGLYGIGPPRTSHRDRPTAHGGINETRFESGKIIALTGAVLSTISQADAYNEWRLVTAPMVQTLDVGPALLKWSEPSGLSLQRLVTLESDVDPPLQESAALLVYQAQFYAEDPRAYSQTLTTATGAVLAVAGGGMTVPVKMPFRFTASGGGTVAFVNAGNRPTPPVFRIFGGVTNPTIVCLDTQVRITLNGTVAAGDFLELNAADRTITLNGLTSRVNFYDPANSAWADMPAGTSNFQLVAGAFDGSARLDVLGRSAYA